MYVTDRERYVKKHAPEQKTVLKSTKMLNNRNHLDNLRKSLHKAPLNTKQNGNKNYHEGMFNGRLTVKREIFPDIIQTNVLSKYNLKRKERNFTKKPALSVSLSPVTRRHSDITIANNIFDSPLSDHSSNKTCNSEPDLGSVWKLDFERLSNKNAWNHAHYRNSSSPENITEHEILTEVYNTRDIQLSCVYKDYSELINRNLIFLCDCFDCDPSESTQTIQNKLQKFYTERQKEELHHEIRKPSKTSYIDSLRLEPQKPKLSFTQPPNSIELTSYTRNQESTSKTPKNYLTSFTKQQIPTAFQPAEDHFSNEGYPNSSLVNLAEKNHRYTDYRTNSSCSFVFERNEEVVFGAVSPQNGNIGLRRKRTDFNVFEDNPFNNESKVSLKNTYRENEFVLPTQKAEASVMSPFKLSPAMIMKQRSKKTVTRRSGFKLDSVVAKKGIKFNSSHFREPLDFFKRTGPGKGKKKRFVLPSFIHE